MAEFSKLIITDKGKNLILKTIAEQLSIDFTRIVISGAQYDISELEKLSELDDIKQSAEIEHKELAGDTAIKLQAAFTNQELDSGYYICTIGLYANDPDVGEILYAATIETTGNCYMPAYNGVAMSGLEVTLIAAIENAENVSLEVKLDPSAAEALLLAKQYADDLVKNIDNHTGVTPGTYGPADARNLGFGDTVEIPQITVDERGKLTKAANCIIKLPEEPVIPAEPKILSGTLTAGQTTVSFNDSAIQEDSLIDIYTDVFGVDPTDISYSPGLLSLIFETQDTDVGVKVRVM